MKQAFMALAIAVFPLTFSGFADEARQPPPAPAIVAQFLGLSDTQAARFKQLLQSLQATAGTIEQQIGPTEDTGGSAGRAVAARCESVRRSALD